MMNIKKVSLSDMFGWVIGTYKLIRNNWAQFALASLVFFLVILIPMIALMSIFSGVFSDIVAQSGSAINWKSVSSVYAIILVVCILLFPPLLAGWMLLCQKLDGRQDTDIGTLFKFYGSGSSWFKICIATALLMSIYILLQAIYIGICYKLGLDQDLKNFLILQLNPKAEVTLSSTFWVAYVGYFIFAQMVHFTMMLGFAEAALSDSSAVQSITKAWQGAVKNIGNYFLLFIAVTFAVLLSAIVLGIVIVLIIAGLAMLQNTIVNGIAIAIAVILYIVLALYIYPLMFSFHFLCWKGILGNDETVVTEDTEVLI